MWLAGSVAAVYHSGLESGDKKAKTGDEKLSAVFSRWLWRFAALFPAVGKARIGSPTRGSTQTNSYVTWRLRSRWHILTCALRFRRNHHAILVCSQNKPLLEISYAFLCVAWTKTRGELRPRSMPQRRLGSLRIRTGTHCSTNAAYLAAQTINSSDAAFACPVPPNDRELHWHFFRLFASWVLDWLNVVVRSRCDVIISQNFTAQKLQEYVQNLKSLALLQVKIEPVKVPYSPILLVPNEMNQLKYEGLVWSNLNTEKPTSQLFGALFLNF